MQVVEVRVSAGTDDAEEGSGSISTALSVGNHTITATVTDDAGATGSSQIVVRIRHK